jgi:hypothetical protein
MKMVRYYLQRQDVVQIFIVQAPSRYWTCASRMALYGSIAAPLIAT